MSPLLISPSSPNELLERKKANAGIRKYDMKLWGLRIPTVIHPNSAARGAFDMRSLVLLIYTGIFTPYQIALLAETHTMRNIPDWTFAFALDHVVGLAMLRVLHKNQACI